MLLVYAYPDVFGFYRAGVLDAALDGKLRLPDSPLNEISRPSRCARAATSSEVGLSLLLEPRAELHRQSVWKWPPPQSDARCPGNRLNRPGLADAPVEPNEEASRVRLSPSIKSRSLSTELIDQFGDLLKNPCLIDNPYVVGQLPQSKHMHHFPVSSVRNFSYQLLA